MVRIFDGLNRELEIGNPVVSPPAMATASGDLAGRDLPLPVPKNTAHEPSLVR